MKVRELIGELGFDWVGEKEIKKFDQDLADASDALLELGKATAAAVGAITLGVVALGGLSRKTAEHAEEVQRSAQALDVGIEKYQEYKFAFDQLGASTDDLRDAFATLTDRSLDAQSGSKNYIESFKLIGIGIDDLKGKKPDQLFDMYMEKSFQMEDRSKAITAAVRLLGDDLGRRIMPAATSASESMARYAKIAREAGLIMSEEQVGAAREAQFAFRELSAVFEAFALKLGLKLVPTFERLTRHLIDFVSNSGGVDKMLESFDSWIEQLDDDLEGLWNTFVLIDKVVDKVFGGWINLVEGTVVALGTLATVWLGAKLIPLVTALGTAISWVGAAFGTAGAGALGPFILLAGWLVFVGLVIEDIITYFRNGNSMLGIFLDKGAELSWQWQLLRLAVNAIAGIMWVLGKAFKAVVAVWKDVEPSFMKALPFIKTGLLVIMGILGLMIGLMMALVAIPVLLTTALAALIAYVIAGAIEVREAVLSAFSALPDEFAAVLANMGELWDGFWDTLMMAPAALFNELRGLLPDQTYFKSKHTEVYQQQQTRKLQEDSASMARENLGSTVSTSKMQVQREGDVFNIQSMEPEAVGREIQKKQREADKDMYAGMKGKFAKGVR